MKKEQEHLRKIEKEELIKRFQNMQNIKVERYRNKSEFLK